MIHVGHCLHISRHFAWHKMTLITRPWWKFTDSHFATLYKIYYAHILANLREPKGRTYTTVGFLHSCNMPTCIPATGVSSLWAMDDIALSSVNRGNLIQLIHLWLQHMYASQGSAQFYQHCQSSTVCIYNRWRGVKSFTAFSSCIYCYWSTILLVYTYQIYLNQCSVIMTHMGHCRITLARHKIWIMARHQPWCFNFTTLLVTSSNSIRSRKRIMLQ